MIKYIVFLLLIAALAACGEEDAYPLKAKCTIVNASPNTPASNLYIDNNQYNIPALSFSNHVHLEINAGKRNIKLEPTLEVPVIDTNLFIVENRNYSLYFVDSTNKVKAILKRDTLTLPAVNKAKIRFIHLSPDAPAVSFMAHGAKGKLESTNQPFKNFPAFAEIDAGNYKIGFSVNNNGGPTYLPDSSALETGKIYTIFLHGLSTSPAGNPQALGLSVIENN